MTHPDTRTAMTLNNGRNVSYVESLDGLRGFAIMLVLLNHGSYGLFPGGFLGVDLFFVISGYLITSLLYAEYSRDGTISIGKFYTRRVLRLYPALLVGILLANLLWDYSGLTTEANRLIASLAGLGYFANLIDEHVLGNMHQLWSLAVEEHFYLFWPVLTLFLLSAFRPTTRIYLVAMFFVAVTAFRIYAGAHEGEWRWGIIYIDAYGFTLFRMDCILLGALLFMLSDLKWIQLEISEGWAIRTIFWVSLLCIGLSGFVVKWSHPLFLNGGFMVTNAISTLLVYATLRRKRSVFQNAVLVWIGKRSYGLYLYHVPVFMALESWRVPHSYGNFLWLSAVRFVLSFSIAELSYRFIEKPVLRYKVKFQTT